MAQFTKQFMTNGKFDYKKIMEHRMQGQLDPLTEEPDNDQFTQEVKTAEAKSQGKGKKAEVAKPSVQAVKNEEVEMYDADTVNGVSVETISEGKKWIAGAIKKPGALHKQLGVPEGEKIPAGKLEKAAEESGKMGKRARLAKTLKTLRKESLERIEEDELTPKQKKIAKIAGDPHKIDQHDLKALRSGHQMKEETMSQRDARYSREYKEGVMRDLEHMTHMAKEHGTASDVTAAHKHLEDARKAGYNVHHKAHKELKDKLYNNMINSFQMKEEVELDENATDHKQFMATYKRNETQNRHMDNVVHLAKHYGSPEELQTAKQHLEDGRKAGYNIHAKANHALHSKLWDRMHKLHSMKEDVEQIEERELTPAETKKKEEVVKSMKKKLPGFKERYGERAKEVMYATATKVAKKG